MKEIYPGIFMVTVNNGHIKLFYPPVNIYIITGNNGLIYEAGYGSKNSIDFLLSEIKKIKTHCRYKKNPFSISRILVSHTHHDHFSGLKKISKSLGLSIVLTKQMLDMISSKSKYVKTNRIDKSWFDNFYYSSLEKNMHYYMNEIITSRVIPSLGADFVENPDMIIAKNCNFEINGENWQIIHTPGHSREHISLYDPKRGILFSGDNIMRSVITWLGHPHSDLDTYIKTLESILELKNLKLILGSHGSPVLEPKKRIKEIIEWRKKRTLQVYSIIANNNNKGLSYKDILNALYSKRSWYVNLIASGWVQLTLECLINNNKIIRIKTRGNVVFKVRS